MTAGTMFLMWLGEQIDEFGIGNGISLLIMAGILARMPSAGLELLQQASFDLSGSGGKIGIAGLIVLAAMFVAVVMGVVFITLGQRRITMQSAKHVRGRRVFGGTKNYMPLKVNQAGVMPIIFASSLLMFPMIIFTNLANIANPDSLVRPHRRVVQQHLQLREERSRIRLQPLLFDPDLLLLLLLDRHYVQPERHGG